MAKSKKVALPKNSRVAILNNLLIKSALAGKLTDVQKWIDQGANLNAECALSNIMVDVGSSTITPIAAILFGKVRLDKTNQNEEHFKILQLMVEKGADVNKTIWHEETEHFHTPLALAVMYGFKDFVEYLIENGAKMDIRYRDNTNLLFLAVERNHVEIAKFLLEFKQIKSKINFKHKVSGYSPLHIAASQGNLEMSKLLVDHGANVNVRNAKDYKTVLHYACLQKFSLDFVKLLVEKGAEIDSKDYFGGTPMMMALMKKNGQLVQFLLENGADANACYNDTINKVKFFPLHMILSSDKFYDHDTLLEMIIFKQLIKHGANINIKCNQYGDLTPLQLAAKHGKAYETKFLIDCGVDMNVQDKVGRTALQIAIMEGSKRTADTAKILIKAGAKVNTQGMNTLWTPLHSAVMFNDFQMVKLLVEAGANVNAEDHDGRTPIRFAYEVIGEDNEDKIIGTSIQQYYYGHHGGHHDFHDHHGHGAMRESDAMSESELKYKNAGYFFYEQFEKERREHHKMMFRGKKVPTCGEPETDDGFEDHEYSDDLDCEEFHQEPDYEYEKQVQSDIRNYLLDNGAYQTEGVGKKVLTKSRLGFKYVR